MARRIGGANMAVIVGTICFTVVICFIIYGFYTGKLTVAPDEPRVDDREPPVAECPVYPVASAYGFIVDQHNPTKRITGFAEAFLYPAGTTKREAVSPHTPYIDKAINDAGKIDFKGGVVKSCTNYALLIKAPGYYCVFQNVVTGRKPPDITSVLFEPPNFRLAKVGSFHTFHASEWTKLDGTPLDGACLSSSGGILTINRTRCTAESLDARILLQIGNTMTGTSIRNAVIQSMNDPASPVQTTAITRATITYKEGTNFGLPSDVTQHIVQGFPITITDDLTADKFGTVFLFLSINNDTIGTGRLSINIEDLEGVNRDDGCGFYGATRRGVEIRVIS